MIGNYTIYERSMNGVKTLSDGISYITDGTASHNNITYTDFLQSSDELTILTNDTVTTVNVNCNALTADNTNIGTVTATTVDCDRLYVRDASDNIVVDFNGETNNLAFNGISNFNNTVNVTNKNIVQTQTGEINQSGTGTNDLKDTNINGFLAVGSNITQSGGSASLKDVTCDNLTMRSGKSITQSGTTVNNTFSGTSTIKDLIILDSVVFPASVTVPGTTTTDDIVMEDNSVIIQDLTVEPSGKTNIFRNTKTLTLEVDGDLDMIEAGTTATLKNTIIQGTAEIQGDITQTTGAAVLKTISCNNITLNEDQNITQSGTGYITQSGTGSNTMKSIELTNNSNLTFNGSGIISQPLNGTNILSNYRCTGFGIVTGRNNKITFTNYQNIQNNNGLQFQYNRDNTSQYSFIMNNRASGGNGGFRFQRYIGAVYLDEPIVIDDSITINKDVSIPGGSISCSSATLGNISQTEINCLDNCSVNIQTKFDTLDNEIDSLQSSSSGNSTALTGISYISGTDTTLIDNNLTISSGKNLLVGSTNVINSINTINTTISGISYDSAQDLTTINNHVLLPTGNNLFLGTGYNVKTNIDDCINKLSGITYTSGTDTTTIDNNVTINKTLIVQGMDIKAEIDALDTSFTTGTINTTNLITSNLTTDNLTVNNTSKFGEIGGSTLFKNDIRCCNVSTKSENDFTQLYQSGITMNIINQLNNGTLSYQAKNNSGVQTEYMKVNSTSFNVKNTNVDIDTNLNVDGEATFNNGFVSTPIASPIYSYSKIFGFSNVLVATITIGENFKQPINISCPISSYRTGRVNNSGNTVFHDDTLSAISCYYTITNFQSATTLPVTVNNTLPATKRTVHVSPQYNYEQYFTNAFVTLPSYTLPFTGTLEYKIYFNFTYSYLSNFNDIAGTVQAGYSVNTDVSDTQFNPALGQIVFQTASGINYSASSFNVNYIDTNNIFLSNVPSQTKTSILVSNSILNQNNIETNSLNTQNTTTTNIAIGGGYVTNNLRCKTFIAGYLVDGAATNYNLVPIFCSLNGINPNNAADYFFIMPGFKFELYDGSYYNTFLETIENPYDYTELFQLTTPVNRVSSIKVFFRPTNSSAYQEIRYLPLSANSNGT
jgi:hypothetical protein